MADVILTPGVDIQAAVDANPGATRFLFGAGIYRFQQVSPKSGNVFDGRGVAVMTGGRVLTGWVADGPRWYVGGLTQQGSINTAADCRVGFPRCNHPNHVFYAGLPLRHVESLAQVTAGSNTFFFDYAADRIYIGKDPVWRNVLISVTPFAFRNLSATDVTIENFAVIQKYATPTQEGTIRGGARWVIRNNLIRLNSSLGVDANDGWLVSGNKIVRNGMAGYGGNGDGLIIENNEIGWNGYAGVEWDWEAGGGKLTDCTDAIIRNNCVHDNLGPGIWLDEDANDSLVEGNHVYRNAASGIMLEISDGAIIRNNVCMNNGKEDTARKGWFWACQILISSAKNAHVYRNKIDCHKNYGNAICIISQDRAPYTPAVGNHIHGNTVTLRGTDWGRMGAATDVDEDTGAVAAGNSMSDNTYHMAHLGRDYWNWNDGDRTLEQMKAIGQETGSTEDGILGPVPAMNCSFLGNEL